MISRYTICTKSLYEETLPVINAFNDFYHKGKGRVRVMVRVIILFLGGGAIRNSFRCKVGVAWILILSEQKDSEYEGTATVHETWWWYESEIISTVSYHSLILWSYRFFSIKNWFYHRLKCIFALQVTGFKVTPI